MLYNISVIQRQQVSVKAFRFPAEEMFIAFLFMCAFFGAVCFSEKVFLYQFFT